MNFSRQLFACGHLAGVCFLASRAGWVRRPPGKRRTATCAAVARGDQPAGVAGAGRQFDCLQTYPLDGLHNVGSADHAAKHRVLAVQPRAQHRGDEELGAVGVGPCVGHGEREGAVVLQVRHDLVLELAAPNGLACAIAVEGVHREVLDGAPAVLVEEAHVYVAHVRVDDGLAGQPAARALDIGACGRVCVSRGFSVTSRWRRGVALLRGAADVPAVELLLAGLAVPKDVEAVPLERGGQRQRCLRVFALGTAGSRATLVGGVLHQRHLEVPHGQLRAPEHAHDLVRHYVHHLYAQHAGVDEVVGGHVEAQLAVLALVGADLGDFLLVGPALQEVHRVHVECGRLGVALRGCVHQRALVVDAAQLQAVEPEEADVAVVAVHGGELAARRDGHGNGVRV
ncbi:40S ribosomal protein S20 [Babesia caballi]|uniref:40S ribosomal protein S20 n=1 Tax=Babesia caballi TaxID=5871 RepID=A0AAV4LSF2_BABCB|nr:40S ribosomal protein S20 [Babesia caballi]